MLLKEKKEKKRKRKHYVKGKGKEVKKKKKPLKALTLTKLTLKKRVYSDIIIIAVSAANQLCEWRMIGGLILREIITDDR